MSTRMVTILHPHFNPHPNGLHGKRVEPKLNDYVSVPWLSTIGHYPVKQLLPEETIVALAKLANQLDNKRPNYKRIALR